VTGPATSHATASTPPPPLGQWLQRATGLPARFSSQGRRPHSRAWQADLTTRM